MTTNETPSSPAINRHQPPSAVDTQHTFSGDGSGECIKCGNGIRHTVHLDAVDTQQVKS